MKLRALILALAAAAASCTDGTVQAGGTQLLPSSAQASLLEQLAAGPETVAHQGVRRVEVFHVNESGVSVPLVYREEIAVAPDGSFSLIPLSVDTTVQPDEPTFLLMQEARAGYMFRYRDFRIRDLDLLIENYLLVAVATEPKVIAGRTAELLSFAHVSGQGPDYEVWVDVTTGLALSVEVFDGDRALLQRTVYESYTDGAPVNFTAHRSSNREVIADLAEPLYEQLGVNPIVADIVPDGYELHELARVVDPAGFHWSKATYTDGVRVLFLLGRNAATSTTEGQGGLPVAPVASIAPGSVGQMAGPVATDDDYLIGHDTGRIVVLEGRYGDQARVAVGVEPTDELQAFLESSL